MSEKIFTLHKDPTKSGRNIDLAIYNELKSEFLTILKNCSLTHTELIDKLTHNLKEKIQGNIGWYSETVKLDLEARGIIGRTKDKPQRYYLVK